MANSVDVLTKTYTTFSGADITATFNGKVIGELQAITYSISREKAPVYTLGSAEPRSFSRGKRGIAGTLVFTVFNRDALIAEFQDKMTESTRIQKFIANGDAQATGTFLSIEAWDDMMSGYASPNGNNVTGGRTGGQVTDLVKRYDPKYADEILPFDVTVTFANEYGQKAVLVVYGVELLNEGVGFSVDNVTTEKAYTFVARRVDHMRPVDENNDWNITASW